MEAHSICLLGLACVPKHSIPKVHPRDCRYQNVHLLKAGEYFIINNDHSLFLRLAAEGYLGSFCLLASVSNASWDAGVLISLPGLPCHSFGTHPEAEALEHAVALLLIS